MEEFGLFVWLVGFFTSSSATWLKSQTGQEEEKRVRVGEQERTEKEEEVAAVKEKEEEVEVEGVEEKEKEEKRAEEDVEKIRKNRGKMYSCRSTLKHIKNTTPTPSQFCCVL